NTTALSCEASHSTGRPARAEAHRLPRATGNRQCHRAATATTHATNSPSGRRLRMATVSPQEPWAYTLQLPHDPRAPRIARTTLRAILASHDLAHITDMAELLACELVTNAYLHSDGPSSMRLRNME